MKREPRATFIFKLAICFLMAWLAVAQIVFALRHPWATDTERLVHIGTVMTFGKMEYAEARPR